MPVFELLIPMFGRSCDFIPINGILCHLMCQVATPHHSHPCAPVFVKVEAVDFDVGREAPNQRLEGAVKPQHRGDEVDQRRLVLNRYLAEETRGCEMTAAPLRFDPAPVVCSL